MNPVLSLLQLAGVAALLSAFARLWRIGRLRLQGTRTTGTVVEHVPSGGPWIVFHDQQGHPHHFTPGLISSWARSAGIPEGTRVEVVYLPEDPQKVRLLVDTAPIKTDKSLGGRARRYAYFKAARLKGHTKRKEDQLRLELRHRGIPAVGTVTVHDPSSGTSRNSPTTCYPRIEFRDQRGEACTFVHQWARVGAKPYGLPAVGEQVPVVYLPASPHMAWMPGAARTLVDLGLRLSAGLLLLLFVRILKGG